MNLRTKCGGKRLTCRQGSLMHPLQVGAKRKRSASPRRHPVANCQSFPRVSQSYRHCTTTECLSIRESPDALSMSGSRPSYPTVWLTSWDSSSVSGTRGAPSGSSTASSGTSSAASANASPSDVSLSATGTRAVGSDTDSLAS